MSLYVVSYILSIIIHFSLYCTNITVHYLGAGRGSHNAQHNPLSFFAHSEGFALAVAKTSLSDHISELTQAWCNYM
jgi:hypothetical protein